MTDLSITRPKAIAGILMVLFPISFLVAIPWLKEQPDTIVHLFSGIAATGTVVSAFVLAIFKDKELDEWHRGAARFSNQWGWLAGGGLIAILQAAPAFRTVIVYITSSLTNSAGSPGAQVVFAFMLGFMAVILAQMVCILALHKGWRVWMSRETSS